MNQEAPQAWVSSLEMAHHVLTLDERSIKPGFPRLLEVVVDIADVLTSAGKQRDLRGGDMVLQGAQRRPGGRMRADAVGKANVATKFALHPPRRALCLLAASHLTARTHHLPSPVARARPSSPRAVASMTT